MRPASIVVFDRLFLASLAISVLGLLLGYDAMAAQWSSDPSIRQLGLGSGFLIGAVAMGLLIYLLLWFLISRKASNVAKWVMIVFVAIGLVSLPAALSGPWNLTLVLGLLNYALEVAALYYLFKPDAKEWLTGQTRADADTSE